ncbi:MAG: DsbA family oxidoreductase [Acidiferrobacterales bacterium]
MSPKPELLVTVYSDYICPFCYIGHVRLARLRDQYELKVNWRFIEIHPETPSEGQSVEKLGYEPEQWQLMMDNLQRMASEDGISFGDHRITTNSHKALLLAEAAKEEGREIFYKLNENLYQAYFVDGKNIGDVVVLETIAKKSGVNKETIRLAWQGGKYEEVLNKNLLNAVALNVTGTPTFFFGKNKLTGAVPEAALRDAAKIEVA